MAGNASTRKSRRGKTNPEDLYQSKNQRNKKRVLAEPPAEMNDSDVEVEAVSDDESDFTFTQKFEIAVKEGGTILTEFEKYTSRIELDDKIKEKAMKKVKEDQLESMIQNTMRFVLFTNAKKEKCTTSKIKIHAMKPVCNDNCTKEVFMVVMSKVQQRMKDLFGYLVVPDNISSVETRQRVVEKEIQIKNAGEAGNNECWYVVNGFNNDSLNHQIHKGFGVEKRGFLMTILGLIMSKGSKIEVNALWKLLESKCGTRLTDIIDEDNSKTAEEIMKDLISEMYIVKRMIKSTTDELNNPVYEYTYGPRSIIEIGLKRILQFLGQTANVKLDSREIKELLRIEDPTKKKKQKKSHSHDDDE